MNRALWMATGIVCIGLDLPLRVWAANAPFHDKPASAQSLPADNLPPFGMLGPDGKLIPAPPIPVGGLHRGSDSPPESTAAGPSLSDAIVAARGALESCRQAGYRVGATVVDSAGEARAMLTADGSDGSHVFVAMRKALTALQFKMASSRASEAVPNDRALLQQVTPAMFVEGGALPIVMAGKTIGAIGVSGAGGLPIGRQDELCAAAGLAQIAASHPWFRSGRYKIKYVPTAVTANNEITHEN